MSVFEDGHSNRATPVPFPNTEVKPVTSAVLVSEKRRSTDAVFFNFFKIKAPIEISWKEL